MMGRFIGFVVGALLFQAGIAAPLLAARPDRPIWLEEYHKGMKRAREQGAPVVVFFDLQEAKASHELWVRLNEDPRLVQAMAPFVRIRLEEPDLGISMYVYHNHILPALVVLDRYERIVGKLTFPQPDEQWTTLLVSMCADAFEPVGEGAGGGCAGASAPAAPKAAGRARLASGSKSGPSRSRLLLQRLLTRAEGTAPERPAAPSSGAPSRIP